MGSIGLLLLIGADHEIPVFSLAYDKVVAGLNESIFLDCQSRKFFISKPLHFNNSAPLHIYLNYFTLPANKPQENQIPHCNIINAIFPAIVCNKCSVECFSNQ